MAIREVPQGTRVPSPVFGTQDGPKQPPTATQFGGNEEIPNTQSTVTQTRGWPPNPAENILSPSGNRTGVLSTSDELQVQPAPGRILRQLFARVFGFTGDGPVAGVPVTAEWSLIPHQYVPRSAQRTGPSLRGMDDNAPIPAVYAGNPNRG